MISHTAQSDDLPQSKKMMTMAIMVALGVILNRLEALLPLPSPWIKLVLANLMTLVALVFLGFKEAVFVTFLRVVIGSILGGTFLGSTFFLSLVGSIAANIILQDKIITFGVLLGGAVIVTVWGSLAGWPVDQPGIFYLPMLQDWIYNNPNVAGARAIMIGIGLGIFATSIRYILGVEKSYIGE